MNNLRFLDGYKNPAQHISDRGEPDEVKSLMEGPRKWSSFFDRQLVKYLSQSEPDSPDIILAGLEEYQYEWLVPHLNATIKDSYELGEQFPESRQAISELNFHAMSYEMMPMWYSLLLTDAHYMISNDDLHIMQTRLAMRGLAIREKIDHYRKPFSVHGAKPGMDGPLLGKAAEIDGAIVLAEVLKIHTPEGNRPHVIVPAPPRFEAGRDNSRNNSDYLLIDRSAQQARGIQQKAKVHGNHIQENGYTSTRLVNNYDTRRVTLIDGIADFDSFRTVPGRFDGGYLIKPDSGSIALDYLHERVSLTGINRHPILKYDVAGIMRAKGKAREYIRAEKRKPTLDTAVQRIAERVLTDLYK